MNNIDILEKFCEIKINSYAMKFVDISYPDLQQAISKLISENKELKEENKKLTDEYMIQKHLINAEFLDDYILKSKVEKEIDKLNKKEKDLQNSISDEEREEHSDANISFDLMDIDIRRETLQSLLGKE